MSRSSDKNGFAALMTGWTNQNLNATGYGMQSWFRSSSGSSPHAGGRVGVRDFGLGKGYDDNEVIPWNDPKEVFIAIRCTENK